MFVICTYDVDEKKCSKVMKVLRKYLFHIQKSVFEGTLTPNQLENLKVELSNIISSQDSLLIYISYNDKQIYKFNYGKKQESKNIIIDSTNNKLK